MTWRIELAHLNEVQYMAGILEAHTVGAKEDEVVPRHLHFVPANAHYGGRVAPIFNDGTVLTIDPVRSHIFLKTRRAARPTIFGLSRARSLDQIGGMHAYTYEPQSLVDGPAVIVDGRVLLHHTSRDDARRLSRWYEDSMRQFGIHRQLMRDFVLNWRPEPVGQIVASLPFMPVHSPIPVQA